MKINKIICLVTFFVMIISFSACSYTFDPSNRTIEFLDGKPYRLPYAAFTGLIADDNFISFVNKYVPNQSCKKGDAIWINPSHYKRKKEYEMTDSKGQVVTNIKWWIEGFNNSLIGCTSPMSNQEYGYYTGKELQEHEQDIQAQKNANESLNNLPKTYNINVYNH